MIRGPATTKPGLAFGAHLKTLRTALRLSLSEVSRHARKLALDSAGRISSAYINQLENGLPVAVTLPKLLSLAAVYNVGVKALLSQLPEPLRSQRLADLESWRAEGHAIPEALDRVPGRGERTDAQLDGLFAKRARGFALPWGEWKNEVETVVRTFLPYAILPAFLEGSPGVAEDFWKRHPPRDVGSIGTSWTAGGLGGLALIPHSPWAGIADSFVGWAARATDAIEGAVRLVEWWSLNLATSLAACHFTSPELDERYGFDSVPPGIVIAVRRWQVARFLFQHGPPPAWPPPPDPIEGARAFVEYLLRPQPFLPDNAPDEPLGAATICASLSALLNSVPRLRSANIPVNTALVDGVASLLHRAAAQPASALAARKKRGRAVHHSPG